MDHLPGYNRERIFLLLTRGVLVMSTKPKSIVERLVESASALKLERDRRARGYRAEENPRVVLETYRAHRSGRRYG